MARAYRGTGSARLARALSSADHAERWIDKGECVAALGSITLGFLELGHAREENARGRFRHWLPEMRDQIRADLRDADKRLHNAQRAFNRRCVIPKQAARQGRKR
jgi:hypothetical protein